MDKKKWITYGLTGALGIGILAGGAAAAANSMDLRTTDGNVVPGGAITEKKGVLDRDTVQLRETDSSVSVISAPSVQSPASAPSAQSPASVPSPQSAQSPDSPASVPSADSD